MRRVSLPAISDRLASLRRPVFLLFAGLLAALAAPGCGHKEKAGHTSVAEPPTVQLIQPQVRNIVRVVGQPSFIQSYERSSVYPKMNAYIQKWIVDIGDKVKKDDVLATLFVPELVEDYGTKKATVVLDRERVALAKVVVEVAKANVKAAEARLEEARAELASYQAEVERWDSEAKRLQRRGRPGRGHSPGSPPGYQSVEGEHRRAGRGEGDRHQGGRRPARPAGRALQGRGRRRGRRSRPESGRERGEAAQGLGGLPRTARAV